MPILKGLSLVRFGPADLDQICVDWFILLAQGKWPLLSLFGLSLSGCQVVWRYWPQPAGHAC